MRRNTTIYHPREILTLKLCISLNTNWDYNCFPTRNRILYYLQIPTFYYCLRRQHVDLYIKPMCLVECQILAFSACACGCSLFEVIEEIQQLGNHIWMFFFILIFFYPLLFSSLSIIKLSPLCKLYLICFPLFCSYPSIILLQCFSPCACVSWNMLKLRLSWRGNGVKKKKSARLCGLDPHPTLYNVPGLTCYTALLNPSNLLYSSSV